MSTRVHGACSAVNERISKLEALAARPGTEGEGAAARAAIQRLKQHLHELSPPSLIGRLLNDIGRRCGRCDGVRFTAGPASGPHAARLDCAGCGAFAGWLSKLRAAELLRELAP